MYGMVNVEKYQIGASGNNIADNKNAGFFHIEVTNLAGNIVKKIVITNKK